MSRAGVRRAVGFIAAAHRSYSSCTQYAKRPGGARRAGVPDCPMSRSPTCPDWFNHVLFVEANAQCVSSALARIEPTLRDGAELVFTAHSIPESMAARYPYRAQFEETARLVAERAWQGGVMPPSIRVAAGALTIPGSAPTSATTSAGARARHRGGSPQSDWLRLRPRRSALRPRRRSPWRLRRDRLADGPGADGQRPPQFLDMMADVVLRVCSRYAARARSNWCLRPSRTIPAAGAAMALAIQRHGPGAVGAGINARSDRCVGLKVGHHTLTEGRPGARSCSRRRARPLASTCAAARRTRETDSLAPTSVEQVTRSARWWQRLRSRRRRRRDALPRRAGVGFKFGGSVVPIVPAAILFDLRVGDGEFVQAPTAVSRRPGGHRRPGSRRERRRRRWRDRGQDGRTGRAMKGGIGSAASPSRTAWWSRRSSPSTPRRHHRSRDRPGRRRHAH